ncbi:MAG: B12-binding domain-containing radical SAM protein, partial [Aggregatilineales bacterium]
MDILLAHAYFLFDDPHELQVMKPYPPLGILYISSYLKSKGFDVGVFDATFQTIADFKACVMQERPTVVGIYINMMTKRNALKMIATCKMLDIPVIIGGPDPPHYAEQYLSHGADIVVRGEGEITLEDLLPHIAKYGLNQLENVNGISFLNSDGQMAETQPRLMIADLSSHPWPDREAIDIPRYMQTWKDHHGYSSVSVIHARGCPYTCTWCSHSVFGNTHRRRTPEDAADELLWIKERYNPDKVWYADDVFAMNHRWLFAYAAALEEHGVKIPFESISRADRLNEKVVQTLAEMGCFRIWNGSESGSQKILDAMKRKVKIQDVQAKTHLLQKYGIEAGMFIMLGYHGETIEDLE